MTNVLAHQLIWCLTSPPLLNSQQAPFSSLPMELAPLDCMGDDYNAMRRWLRDQNRSQRLGITFEQCFEAYLRHSRSTVLPHVMQFKNVHNRIQINSAADKRTIGELDFICQDRKSETWVHIETAVKFYLGLEDDLNLMNSWVGPNKNDRLDIKYNSLFTKQLNLTKAQEAIQKLKELGVDPETKWQTRFWVKGMLYRPWNAQPTRLPKEVNPNCLLGYWLTQSQLPTLRQSLQPNLWYILDRKFWIMDDSSVIALSNDHYDNATNDFESLLLAIFEALDSTRTPVQIMVRYDHNLKDRYQRYFITPDDWPDSILPSFTQ